MAVLAAPVLGTYAVPGWIPACAGMTVRATPCLPCYTRRLFLV